jgi:hypothetical protein
VCPTLGHILALYERGAITRHDAARRIVESSTSVPLSELVDTIPAEIVEVIEHCATQAPNTKWIRIESWCGSDLASHQREMDESAARWQSGLAFWRTYFETATL